MLKKHKKNGYYRIINQRTGLLKLVKHYKNGIVHGKIIYYWDNGQIRLTGQYEEMRRTGIWETYDSNGDLIMENNYKYPIKMATISFSTLKDSVLMLDESVKKNILIVHNYDEADFLITNYMKRLRKNYEVDEKRYVKYFEVIVNDVPINTVYKKIN